uniref:Uncharacterized protein n=1 Tax=Haematobia irritans TaxID=7368 RepID=A0A1L8E6L3_HAEIR
MLVKVILVVLWYMMVIWLVLFPGVMVVLNQIILVFMQMLPPYTIGSLMQPPKFNLICIRKFILNMNIFLLL